MALIVGAQGVADGKKRHRATWDRMNNHYMDKQRETLYMLINIIVNMVHNGKSSYKLDA